MPMTLSIPFTSINNDRLYTADDVAAWYASVLTDGVHPNPGDALFVRANNDWTATVLPGRCVMRGRLGMNALAETLNIAPASPTFARRDCVVAQLNYALRGITLAVKVGTPAASPPPPLQRDELMWELCLAEITVPANASMIRQQDIRDRRDDAGVCGRINSLIQADASSLFAQYEVMLSEFVRDFTDGIDGWRDEQKTAFEGWRSDRQEELEAWLNGLTAVPEDTVLQMATLAQINAAVDAEWGD